MIELFDDLQLSETRGLRTSSIDQFGNQESEPLVEIQDVSFSYFKKAPNILNCISMTIAKGDCVGIVGPTGGGKTTLVDLLSGLIFADKGKVIVNGQPLNAHNAEYWRNHLAYVAQDDVILDTSLLQNVVFGRKQNEGSAKRVKELLELVQLGNLLDELSDGLFTDVGENGVLLSGGQKQRVSMARALYSNPQLLILDEATSALDNDTEALVINNIQQKYTDTTIVMVAHRLNTLDNCNKIYQVGGGNVRRFDMQSQIKARNRDTIYGE